MDGLEDQAEATLAGLLQQLHCEERVEIGRSSRDTVMSHIAAELQNHNQNGGGSYSGGSSSIVTKTLVLRGGISINGLAMLQQGLARNESIEELEFVCLKTVQEIEGAIDCCRRQPRIRSLTLNSYSPPLSRRAGEGRDVIAATIRDSLFGKNDCDGTSFYQEHVDDEDEDLVEPGRRCGSIPSLKTLEIVGYPLGTEGLQILSDAVAKNTTLSTLRLMDCDLRSDSASNVAKMIKRNIHLKELDLSYNTHFLGSEITRELTLQTLVRRGLRFNLSLLELKLEQTRGGPIKRSKIDRQLNTTRFRAAFLDSKRDPFRIPPQMWTHVLARAAEKPTAVYLFLQESVVTLFR